MARTSKYYVESTAISRGEAWRAGLYIRLSREDGDKAESESISSQKAILERFVIERPEISLYQSYVDDGWSGTDFERPAFKKMIADVTAGKLNCVIVKDLSRFGRNYVEAGKYLETVFPLFKVRFIAVNDSIDSFANPQSANNIIVPFKNIINDEYCRDISMKVRSALDVRRKQGKFIGSFAAYGYKKDKADHSKLVIDDEAAAVVKKIYNMFLSGHSVLGIAAELNALGILNPSAYKNSKGLKCRNSGALWCDSTVRRILTSEVYIGNLVQKKNQIISHKIHVAKAVEKSGRIRVENTHQPIISAADFKSVQNLLKRDVRTSPKENKLSVFSGFVKCADCGRAMQKRTVKQPYKTYEYYVCSTYKRFNKKACTKHAIRVDFLEKAVLEALNKYISIAVDFERVIKKLEAAQKTAQKACGRDYELSQKLNEKRRYEELLLEIYPDYKSGILSKEQYLALKQKYENAVAAATKSIERIEQEKLKQPEKLRENEFISTFKKYRGFKRLTREIMTELIENIYVCEGGEIEIHLKCRQAFLSAAEYIEKNKTEVKNPSAPETA